jgi:hypothetical protein
MRAVKTMGLTALLAAVLAGSAFSQPNPGGGVLKVLLAEGIPAPVLLLNKGVRQELQMRPAQSLRLLAAVKEVREKYRPQMEQARADKDRDKFLELLQKSTEETSKAVLKVLTPKQQKRLAQLDLQINGILALSRPEVQKELKLTDKQKDEIEALHEKFMTAAAAVVKDGGNEPPKLQEIAGKLHGRNQESTRKALAGLSEEQKKTWAEMTGPPFTFRPEMSGPPGGQP